MSSDRHKLWPYYLIVLGVVFGGASPVLTKLLLREGLPGPTLVAIRYAVAVLVLMPAGLYRPTAGAVSPPTRRDWVGLILVGVFGSGVGALLFVAAVDLSSAGMANALSKTQPLFVAFLAYHALRERISSVRWTLIGVMVAAAVLIAWGEYHVGGVEDTLGRRILGDVLALGAGLARALAEIIGKRSLEHFAPRTVTLARFGVGLLFTGLFGVATGAFSDLTALSSGRVWALLVGLGVGCTALSTALHYQGLRHVEAHVAASLRLLGAVVTVILSVWVLGEQFNPFHVAGISVLLFGAYLIVVRTARMETTERVREVERAASRHAQEAEVFPVQVSLKLKIAVFAVAMIVLTMFTNLFLSVQHTTKVVENEIRLTMAQIASHIGALAQVSRRPDWTTYQQFIDRVVASKIAGEEYSVEIVYIAVLDAAGHVNAFAYNPEVMELRDGRGRIFRSGDLQGGQGLLAMSESGSLDARGLVRTTAHLGSAGGGPRGTVEVAYRKSIAAQAINRIRSRECFLALLLVMLGIVIAVWLAGNITRPLERLTTAMRRLQRGDLDVSVLVETNDEVGLAATTLNDAIGGLRKKVFLENTLRRYVSVQVAERIIAEGRDFFEPARRRVTVMFADLRGFTPLAEDMSPEQIFEMLNEYFGIMVEAIFKYDGMIDKYMGDCVMAVWGAWREEEQDDALRAVLAAMEMQSQLRALNAIREQQGKPRIIAGAGINTGYVAAGSLGAATETITQWEYAVIGDNVNLAQRIESQTNGYQVIISQPTYEEVKEYVTVRALPPLQLKGRREMVPVYLVTGVAGEEQEPELPAPVEPSEVVEDALREGEEEDTP